MNVIARLEFELAYYDSAVHRFNHYTTRTPPFIFKPTSSDLWGFRILSLNWFNYSIQMVFVMKLSREKVLLLNWLYKWIECQWTVPMNRDPFQPIYLSIYLLQSTSIYLSIYPKPSARAGYDTRSIFKRSLTGLNSEFSFS